MFFSEISRNKYCVVLKIFLFGFQDRKTASTLYKTNQYLMIIALIYTFIEIICTKIHKLDLTWFK